MRGRLNRRTRRRARRVRRGRRARCLRTAASQTHLCAREESHQLPPPLASTRDESSGGNATRTRAHNPSLPWPVHLSSDAVLRQRTEQARCPRKVGEDAREKGVAEFLSACTGGLAREQRGECARMGGWRATVSKPQCPSNASTAMPRAPVGVVGEQARVGALCRGRTSCVPNLVPNRARTSRARARKECRVPW